MNSKIERLQDSKVKLEITIDSAKFAEGMKKAYKKNASRFNIPGFRKGKAPQSIIERQYGPEVFYDDAINAILPEAYEAAIKEHGIDPVDSPEIDVLNVAKGEDLVLTITVIVAPEVTLGKYKGFGLVREITLVDDDMIAQELKKTQDKNGRIVEVDRAIELGDTITMDYKGFVGEEQFEGGTAENQTLEIGSGRFIPGFEDQLIGASKGERKDILVTFPEDYRAENLAGKEAKFEVDIKAIKAKELPALDDEFAKEVSEFDTLEELKADIKEKLTEKATQDAENKYENDVLEACAKEATVAIPPVMIEKQLDSMVKDFEYRLKYQGLDLEKYLEITNSTIESMKESMRENAETRVKNDLVIQAIAKAENISYTDDEVESELSKLAEVYKMEVSKLKKSFGPRELEHLSEDIVIKKTIKFMVDNAN